MIKWSREVTELTKLALARFSNLTESELKVLCAVTTGEFAFCGPIDPLWQHHNDPVFADFWGFERDVTADLIRWLLVDREASTFVDPLGIQIDAARIGGALDLSFVHKEFPSFFKRCRLVEPVSLLFAHLGSVQLSGCLSREIRGWRRDILP
jgi:hypothetical protein